MSILCLWNIQLTLDWDEIEPYGAYPNKSALKRCKCVQEFFYPAIFAEVIANLELARSTRMDISIHSLQCTYDLSTFDAHSIL